MFGGAVIAEDFGGTGEEVTKHYSIAGMRVAWKSRVGYPTLLFLFSCYRITGKM